MPTLYSDLLDIQSNQPGQEAGASTNFNDIDRLLNQVVSKVITGDDSLTTTEQKRNTVVVLTGTPGVAFTLGMFDTAQKVLNIVNLTDSICTVENSAAGGARQPVIYPGQGVRFHYDGTDFRSLRDRETFRFFHQGIPAASVVQEIVITRPIRLILGLSGSQGFARVAATALTTFNIQKNGTNIGTMVFAISGTVATFTFTADVTFIAGDQLALVAPGSADATLADISASLEGLSEG